MILRFVEPIVEDGMSITIPSSQVIILSRVRLHPDHILSGEDGDSPVEDYFQEGVHTIGLHLVCPILVFLLTDGVYIIPFTIYKIEVFLGHCSPVTPLM